MAHTYDVMFSLHYFILLVLLQIAKPSNFPAIQQASKLNALQKLYTLSILCCNYNISSHFMPILAV